MARNPAAQFLTWLYTRLLRLYPPRFREKFGPEMLEVFQQAAAEQARTGAWPLVKFVLGEIGGLLPAVISLRRWKGGGVMDQKVNNPLPAPEAALPPREVVLGVLPLVLLGLSTIIESLPDYGRMPVVVVLSLYILPYLAVIAGLWRGWQMGFPRWFYPYPLYAVLFAIYFLLGVSVGAGVLSMLTWLILVPLGVVLFLALRSGKSPVKAVDQVFAAIWKDWTLLVYALYGLLPLLIPIMQDETGRDYRFPTTALAVAIMLAGAITYVAAAKPWLRTISVLGGLFLSMLTASVGATLYWSTHDINITTNERTFLGGPTPWRDILAQSVPGTTIFTLGLLALPALVGFLHWLSRARRSGSSGAGA